MKKIRTWLKTLPEPIKTRAMKYDAIEWSATRDSLENALYAAFLWRNSEEGLEYWCLVIESKYDQAEQLLKEATK
jgi:hypothetical protein